MLDELRIYFDGEKYAGLLLAGAALGMIVAAAIMLRSGHHLRSFAMTLGLVAAAEVALGVGLYLRTGPQVTRLTDQLRSDSPAFYAAEAGRMARVQRNFIIVEYAELVIVIGAALAAISLKARPGAAGIALGVLINASILLAFDTFAERRGAAYLAAVADRGRSGL